jgi:hypothetical protein
MSRSGVVAPFRVRSTRRSEVALLVASAAIAADGERWAVEVRDTLERLGPAFGAFAVYMGSRVDLLSALDCYELARAHASPRPPQQVRALLAAEAAVADGRIRHVDVVPTAVTAATQTHAARLADGTAIDLEIPTAVADAGEDLELLTLTDALFAPRVAGPALTAAADDFRARLHAEWDTTERLAALHAAMADMARGAPVIVPRPSAELSSPNMLVTVLDDEDWRIAEQASVEEPDADARALLSAWLRLALFESAYPMLAPHEPIRCIGNRFMARQMIRSNGAVQQHLLAYLFAVTSDLPDSAWAALQRELAPTPRRATDEELQRAFRRLVPFRDDRHTESGSATADHIFLQWRTASQHGWLPGPSLVPFYCALFGVVSGTGSTAGSDIVADAIASLRVTADVRQLGGWAAQADLPAAMERQLAMALDLPEKLNRLLSAAADGTIRVQLMTANPAVTTRRQTVSAALSLLLVGAALVVLAGESVQVRQAWGSEPWRSIALVAMGALTVWAIGRFR